VKNSKRGWFSAKNQPKREVEIAIEEEEWA
jgi:hypothetical protein